MNFTLINHNGELYNVKRVIKESSFKIKENIDTDFLKQYFHSDAILKKDGMMFFVEKIEDAQIIEDENINNKIEENEQTN